MILLLCRWVFLRPAVAVTRLTLVAALVIMAAFVCSAAALADSASIGVTNTAGQPDPAAGVPRIFTVSGVASVPEEVFVKYRAPGGAPCAPTADSDSGSTLSYGQHEGAFNFAYGEEVNGAFDLQQVYNWAPPGTYAFCIWLAKDSTTIATPIPQSITFRSPVGTIAAGVSPTMPGQQATVTITGSSESPAKVYAKIRPAGGAACAADSAGDSGEYLLSGQEVNGSFSAQTTTKQLQAGQYAICLWLAYSENDASPIAGPQLVAFTVASPPPPPPAPLPCVVPTFSTRMRLLTVEHRIRAAHCSVGKIHYSYSRRYHRNAVIRLSARPGSRLSSNAAIGVFVSNGRPRRRKS